MKIYTCICGKSFSISNSFNGHKSHCKVHLGDERWNKRHAHTISMSKKSATVCKYRSKQRKEQILKEWLLTQPKCENCGKDMIKKFGSGRFCCRSCANTRVLSDQTKAKISHSINLNEEFMNTLIARKNPTTSICSIQGYYHNVFCGSTWELAYLIWCLDHNINIVRCTRWFSYLYKGKYRRYIPDWYLPETDTYVEIKGKNRFYDEDKVRAKMTALLEMNINYLYIDDTGIYKYINYCKNKYKIQHLKYLYDEYKLTN